MKFKQCSFQHSYSIMMTILVLQICFWSTHCIGCNNSPRWKGNKTS